MQFLIQPEGHWELKMRLGPKAKLNASVGFEPGAF